MIPPARDDIDLPKMDNIGRTTILFILHSNHFDRALRRWLYVT